MFKSGKIIVLLAFVFLSACAGGGDQSEVSGVNTVLRWSVDIRPIMESRCTTCHYQGNGLGLPGDIPIWTDEANNIDGAQLVSNNRNLIIENLENRSMPLDNITNMTADERQKVIDWLNSDLVL